MKQSLRSRKAEGIQRPARQSDESLLESTKGKRSWKGRNIRSYRLLGTYLFSGKSQKFSEKRRMDPKCASERWESTQQSRGYTRKIRSHSPTKFTGYRKDRRGEEMDTIIWWKFLSLRSRLNRTVIGQSPGQLRAAKGSRGCPSREQLESQLLGRGNQRGRGVNRPEVEEGRASQCLGSWK